MDLSFCPMLGRSGLAISSMVLGALTFGKPRNEAIRPRTFGGADVRNRQESR